ncbi:MAG TPA: metallophosphoesterase family protein [Terriglobia bacterium]|nr:metallophosphoesterase family protein [Terriglobia bacterium]
MRYLILSDIHSNLEALEKSLALAAGSYDQVLCLGDLVGYGPDPNSVISRIRPLAKAIVRGNHDKACCGLTDAEDFNFLARFATEWTHRQLTPDRYEFLRSLPAGPVRVDGIELVHGSPFDEDEYIVDSMGAAQAFQSAEAPLVFFGHSHHQGGFLLAEDKRLQSISLPPIMDDEPAAISLRDDARYLLNPGSIGQPRDGDFRAAFAILDLEQRRVNFYRTPYDLAKTQEKMRTAGLPEPLIARLEIGR